MPLTGVLPATADSEERESLTQRQQGNLQVRTVRAGYATNDHLPYLPLANQCCPSGANVERRMAFHCTPCTPLVHTLDNGNPATTRL